MAINWSKFLYRSGPNQWRDPLKPSQILAKLCKDLKLDGPYIMHNRIRIGSKAFTFQTDGDNDGMIFISEYAVIYGPLP